MNYLYSVPLFFQTMFLIIKKVAPESSTLISFLSKCLIVSVVFFLVFMDAKLISIGFDKRIFLPLVLEYLLFSILEESEVMKKKHKSNYRFSELTILLLFLSTAELSHPVKITILIGAYFLDAFRIGSSKQSDESYLSYFSSLVGALLSIVLLFYGIDSLIGKALLFLLIPLNYFLLPFSLLKTRNKVISYSLGQRVFSILLFTLITNSVFEPFSLELFLPIVVISLGIGLFHKNIISVLKSGKSSIELLFLIILIYFPSLRAELIISDYFWICFFLCIPYLLALETTSLFSMPQAKAVGLLLFLGIIPGPFYNIINSLLEYSRLFGGYSLAIVFLLIYAIFVIVFFTRIISYLPSSSSKRSFSLFDSILLLSSILIGVILSI